MSKLPEELIKKVSAYDYLYDTKDENYKNIKLKDETWNIISNELNINAKDEWRKLRDCHRDALKRRETRSDKDGKPIKKWKYEDLMSFLLPTMKNRERSSTFEFASVDCPSMEDSQFSVDSKPIRRSLSTTETSQTHNSKFEGKRRRESDLNLENVTNSEARTRTCQECHHTVNEQDDAIDLFFKSMAQTTKCLPKKYQAYVKKTVFAAVQEAEDSFLAEQESSIREEGAFDSQEKSPSSILY